MHETLSDSINRVPSIEQLSNLSFEQFTADPDKYLSENLPDKFLTENMHIKIPNCNYYFPEELTTLKCYPDKLFNIACHNINSLPLKIEDFRETCGELLNQLDVLAFCESKVTDST